MSSNTSSVVGDLASAVLDLSSASASAFGKLASSGVSNLVVNPLKGAADIIKSSFTPSTTSVRSSDVFPESQSVRSSDVFPNQTGTWPSSHPSYYMTGSPYPMEYQTDLASQSAAVRAAQQAARQHAAQSAAQSLMSAPPPPSSIPSSSLTFPSSSQTPQGVHLTYQSIQPAQSLPSSSLTYQPIQPSPPSSIPSSSLTFPESSFIHHHHKHRKE